MEKLKAEHADCEMTFDCKSFRGIGGFRRAQSQPGNVKTNKLLNDLPIYLKGFDRKCRGIPGYAFSVFVVLDNDKRNTDELRQQLNRITLENDIAIDHAYCIAIEEMEAWLLVIARPCCARIPRRASRSKRLSTGQHMRNLGEACGRSL